MYSLPKRERGMQSYISEFEYIRICIQPQEIAMCCMIKIQSSIKSTGIKYMA